MAPSLATNSDNRSLPSFGIVSDSVVIFNHAIITAVLNCVEVSNLIGNVIGFMGSIFLFFTVFFIYFGMCTKKQHSDDHKSRPMQSAPELDVPLSVEPLNPNRAFNLGESISEAEHDVPRDESKQTVPEAEQTVPEAEHTVLEAEQDIPRGKSDQAALKLEPEISWDEMEPQFSIAPHASDLVYFNGSWSQRDVYPHGNGIIVHNWCIDGKIHRDDDKPASIWTNNKGGVIRLAWYQHGIQQRGVGPTSISFNGDGTLSAKIRRTKEGCDVFNFNKGVKIAKRNWKMN